MVLAGDKWPQVAEQWPDEAKCISRAELETIMASSPEVKALVWDEIPVGPHLNANAKIIEEQRYVRDKPRCVTQRRTKFDMEGKRRQSIAAENGVECLRPPRAPSARKRMQESEQLRKIVREQRGRGSVDYQLFVTKDGPPLRITGNEEDDSSSVGLPTARDLNSAASSLLHLDGTPSDSSLKNKPPLFVSDD